VAQIEARRFEHAKLETANRILEVALEACKAWYQAIAARQTVHFIEEIQETAAMQAELARRMRAAGNWSALDQAREHLFYADMTAQLTLARLAESRARERLIRALGLWGADLSFALKDRLPDIPTSPRPEEGIEATAVAQRLDLRMAMAEVEGLSRALGLTRTTRFINVLETSYLRNSETDKPRQTGYEISLEIPIFDFGDAKVAKAEAIYMQAVARLGEKAVNARSVVRESYVNYRAVYDLAVHYNREIVPLRQRVSEELMLRYNGMLVSVFELLADARDRIASVVSAIDAQRDFWIADAELSFATVAALDATEGQIGGRAIGTTRSARH
jgi:outer membrane protein TolC